MLALLDKIVMDYKIMKVFLFIFVQLEYKKVYILPFIKWLNIYFDTFSKALTFSKYMYFA